MLFLVEIHVVDFTVFLCMVRSYIVAIDAKILMEYFALNIT